MNFLEKIRSCFWQDDLGAPTQGGNQRGAPHVDESVLIKKTEAHDPVELERKIQELREKPIEMMIPVMMMSKIFWSFLDDFVNAAKELNIEYSLVDNIAYCEGKAKDVENFEALMETFHGRTIKRKKKRNHSLNDCDFHRKMTNWEDKDSVILLNYTMEDVDVILYKAKKQDLKFRLENSLLDVRGKIFDVSLFVEWLEEFTKNRRKQTKDFKEFLENLKLETITEKIQNPTFDDLQKQDLLKKASVLEVKCIFDEDDKKTLEISGRADKVRCFQSYLQAIDPTFPKYLYPKYWDFSIEDAYAEIEVQPGSEEFEEISSKMRTSLRSASVTKIKRIQNQGLMNNYLMMICSEKKKKEERRLLFYGSEIQKPEKIYKYSKAGFDLSYASFKGRFGRGLYFPITALYAHGCAYEPSPKIFQVLVADVFVGEALDSRETIQDFQMRPLKGYDSLLDKNNFYVVYKNSQSYPLYLVEYLQFGSAAFVEERKEEIKVEEEKIVDVRLTAKFECPVELSPQAWEKLKIQLEILNLTLVEAKGSLIRYSGNETYVQIFSQWLNEFFSGIIMGENNLEEVLEKKNEKIAYSMLYHVELPEIMIKATELEVDCLLSKDMDQMTLTGLHINLESFKAYLRSVNHKAKKYMFPKYWDFSIVEPYVEVKVRLGSEEFKEISKVFNYGNENAQVTGLTRIQNYDLFNNYISTICSKTEVTPDKNLQRKLLFHGTRYNNPEEIFWDSEIGFDLKYAKNGSYGRGIYFATNSSYSHRFASTTESGTFQMLIADVYTGHSFIKCDGAYFDRLPEGHDSLFADENDFFVLYQNSQSYPLYLIEYMVSDCRVYKYPQIRQKFMTIISGGQYSIVDDPPASLSQHLDSTCLLRLEKELKNVSRDEFIQDHFLIDQVEKPEWLVSFRGPRGTPYEGGRFKIKIIFPSNYPMVPPSIKFLTQIYHPSINENGRICLGLLSQWTPVTEVRHILLAISCLLHDPEMEDPLMADRLALFKTNRNVYMKIAKDWTLKYAKKKEEEKLSDQFIFHRIS